jgi:hypothetical protein
VQRAMDGRLITLKLFLDALGVKEDVASLDDRKTIQKAVFLGQLSGVDLGYRYGWYLRGPYSPALTRDYFALAQAIEQGERDYEQRVLHPKHQDRLGPAKQVMSMAPHRLDRPEWLELLASYAFLIRASRQTRDQARGLLATQKPNLLPFVDNADAALTSAGLIPKGGGGTT